jgi:hypothetical protein
VGEILGVLIALIATPIAVLAHWFKYIKGLPPREQALARASHGAGMIAIIELVLLASDGPQSMDEFTSFLSSRPEIALPCLAIVAWGAGWFIIGSARSRGPRDALLASRAAVKTAVGFAAGRFVWDDHVPAHWSGEWWGDPLVFGLKVLAIWCMVTGLVKFVLVMRGMGRRGARPAEVEEQKARGAAGDASAAEAAAALHGRGGRGIALDDREF